MQKIMTRTIVSGLLILIGSCTDESTYDRPGNSEAAVLPDHKTPLSLGHDGLVVSVNQRLIKNYGESYAEGGVVELALSEFAEVEPSFLTIMIDLPVTYPEAAPSASAADPDRSEMNEWYEFLALLYGPEDHPYNFVQFVGDPSEKVERFPMLHHIVKWIDWEFQLYFEISEEGSARTLMVCEMEDVSMPGNEDRPRMCRTIFRHNGVVLFTFMTTDDLPYWHDYRATLTHVISETVAPWRPEEGTRANKVRFNLKYEGVTVRPALGSDLYFHQMVGPDGVIDHYQLFFDASTNFGFPEEKQDLSDLLVSDAGRFPTEINVRLHPYRDDREREVQTICETTERKIEEGEPVITTNCEFEFGYGSLLDVGVTYRSPAGTPWPIDASMVTRFLDTIVDPS